MQRWFYATEELICDLKKVESEIEPEEAEPTPIEPQPLRRRRFCVNLEGRELLPNEAVALTGDCEELGNWELFGCIVMTPVFDSSTEVWQVYVDIPTNRDIAYRYLIVAIDPISDQMIVRFFESHLNARVVNISCEVVVDVCEDIFGYVNGIRKVERGWLTTECIVQFKFFKEPFRWLSPTWLDAKFFVKVIPFFRKDLNECLLDAGFYEQSSDRSLIDCCNTKGVQRNDDQVDEIENEEHCDAMKWRSRLCKNKIRSYTKLNFDDSEHSMSFSMRINECESRIDETTELLQPPEVISHKSIKLSTAFAFNEVANTFEQNSDLNYQPSFGTQCTKEDLVTIHLTIGDFNNTVYLVELYKFSKKASADESPYRVGYRYILPEDFRKYRHGFMETPIICASKHRQIGSMKFGFTIIHPHPTLSFDLSISYLRHLNAEPAMLYIGHRGLGKTFYSYGHGMIYENTIFSMKQAIDSGADMIEFDVHLTKDLVPVIYHDFNVHVGKQDNHLVQNFNNIDIPISKYDYEALMNLKLFENNTEEQQARIGDADKRLKLFPKLSEVFDTISENIGFNIELKWPQQLCNHKYEEGVYPFIDRNKYVDRILDVVFSNANRRPIIFTSFDADICSHLRFKQNRYPVMLALRNEMKCTFLDPRVRTPSIAANFAYTMELLGVVPHMNIIQRFRNIIAETSAKNLITFCYGIEAIEDVAHLKKYDVRGIILDRMDEFMKNESLSYTDRREGAGDM